MILIAGAGIGGLTLGCSLARSGIAFRIIERARELRPAGAGIAIAENGLRALACIGLGDRVRSRGQALGLAAICDANGRVLFGASVRDTVPGTTVAMSRTDLQDALLQPLAGRVELGCEIVSYEQHDEGVRARLASGETIDAAVLVGADGLRSVVRRTMRGDEPMRYAGYTSWRAIVGGIALPADDRFSESWGAGQRFGIVPIGNGRIYWFAVADAPPHQRDDPDPRPSLLARFDGWHDPIASLIRATPAADILRTDIFDRVPIDRWVDRRAVLLGDAAHPMTPNLGMGGCQAIEDAIVLGDALARSPSVTEALARYERQRIARANSFVVRSYRTGLVAHMRSPVLRWLRDRALSAVPVGLAARAVAKDLEFRLQ